MNNPLQQYFRKPIIHFKLPSEGKYYEPGVVDTPPTGELPVYPMTSLDEISVKTPDGLFNGSAIVEVIRSCIPSIKDPWKLNSIDLEAIVIAIRAASVDGKIDITSTCPKCDHTETFSVDLLSILAEKSNIDYSTPIKIRDLEIKFKPLTYAESNKSNIAQFQIQRNVALLDEVEDSLERQKIMNASIAEMNRMVYDILTDTIEYIKTPETTVSDKKFIREFLVGTDSKTSNAIKDHSTELRQKNDTKPLKIKCRECDNEYTQPLILNFTDFFA